jgi:hypothetical protein
MLGAEFPHQADGIQHFVALAGDHAVPRFPKDTDSTVVNVSLSVIKQ